ncbi:hypothetical protein ACK8HY_06235 [Sphingobacterium sp. NGMCC 1.201703]|uniref:hypothetical protein n=1 Tax=Sphingobacterium sp. NGMCC 1.201703 TaxID=3388657 RepID=UPI0039FDD1A9
MNNQKKEELQCLLWMANVQGFYPDKSAVELEAGYQRWKDHRQRFALMNRDFPFENILHQSPNVELASLPGSIVFTFHYGPYRLLPRSLVAAGYRLTIVVSASVLDRERTRYALDLAAMGLPADRLECLEASNAMVIRKILQAISKSRLILVFLDANESAGNNGSNREHGRLRVSFGASYFYWRSNLLKLAHRIGLPVYAIHLSPKLHHTGPTWQVGDPLTVLTPADKNNPMALLNAFTKLQEYFHAMMQQDWTAWENWGLMHHYKGFDQRAGIDARCQGSYMVPFSFADKGYLFDLSRKLFYEIIANKDNIS